MVEPDHATLPENNLASAECAFHAHVDLRTQTSPPTSSQRRGARIRDGFYEQLSGPIFSRKEVY